jgi:hypothetical protein
MDNTPKHRPVSRSGGVRKARWVLAVGAAFVVASAAMGVYVVVARPWEADTSSSAEIPDGSEVDVANVGEDSFVRLQQRHFLWGQLDEVVKRADQISEDIDALQSEIDAYEKAYDELQVSEAGKRLVENELAMQYFSDEWGDQLPHKTVAKHFRARLDELMLPIREAVSTREGAFQVARETRQSIELIEFEVAEGKREYSRHRQLLEAMLKLVSEDSNEAVEDALSTTVRQILLKEWGEGSTEVRTGDEPSEAEGDRSASGLADSIRESERNSRRTDEDPDG